MARNRMGSYRMSQDSEIRYSVLISKKPLGEGLKDEFIEMLRKYLIRRGCLVEHESIL